MQEINSHLESQGLRLREGTIVDTSITLAPSSTKNRAGERDPEMHQTKKGNRWHFGMKIHIGVDADTGLVHSMSATAANVHDITEAHNLLHGGETMVWCDAGYQGVHKREENRELKVDWQMAMRPGLRRKLEPGSDEAEKEKASVRAKVEHPFLKVKRIFDYGKVCYRGLAKNRQRLALLLGLGNLISGASTGGLTWRPAGPNPSVGRLRARYSPAGGEITGRKPSVVRARDDSHTRRPAEPKLVQRIPKSIPQMQAPTSGRYLTQMRSKGSFVPRQAGKNVSPPIGAVEPYDVAKGKATWGCLLNSASSSMKESGNVECRPTVCPKEGDKNPLNCA